MEERGGLYALPESVMHNGVLPNLELVDCRSQKLEDDLKILGSKIKCHEDNLRFLKAQANSIDESILDLQVSLGKYHSSRVDAENDNAHVETEQLTIQNILEKEKTAAGIVCQMKMRHGFQASKLPITKDILGVVATLAKVDDDNLSRLFAEYLGMETMLAIVCKTFEGVKAIEKYDKEGKIDESAGLHGLGPSIGRHLDGRFLVFCLENLRPCAGDFVAGDSQKRLVLLKPKLPNAESPPGFLGFAVNMINLDRMHLSCVTPNGHGLRETLFYSLFSRLQVYKTRAQMEHAIPCISDGAISLDGGIIKSSGLFFLGGRGDVQVRFAISSGLSSLPSNIVEIEEQIKLMKWKKERLLEDMQREEALLKHARDLFGIQKQGFMNFLKEATNYVKQTQSIPGRSETYRADL